VAAEHGIADHLSEGPQAVATLAHTIGLPAESLQRLLRSLSVFGVFEETSEGIFSQTELSAFRSRSESLSAGDDPGSE
jgi:DNA-binding IclR family transcriptional regulator